MDDEPVTFTRNKRLIENSDGSHVGGLLVRRLDDSINNVKLDKRGLSLLE